VHIVRSLGRRADSGFKQTLGWLHPPPQSCQTSHVRCMHWGCGGDGGCGWWQCSPLGCCHPTQWHLVGSPPAWQQRWAWGGWLAACQPGGQAATAESSSTCLLQISTTVGMRACSRWLARGCAAFSSWPQPPRGEDHSGRALSWRGVLAAVQLRGVVWCTAEPFDDTCVEVPLCPLWGCTCLQRSPPDMAAWFHPPGRPHRVRTNQP
jgi:hypothetical protein